MIVEMDRDVQFNAYVGMGANLIASCTNIGLAMWTLGGLSYVALGLSFLFGFNFTLLISDIIKLQQLLTNIKVSAFDFTLSIFNGFR